MLQIVCYDNKPNIGYVNGNSYHIIERTCTRGDGQMLYLGNSYHIYIYIQLIVVNRSTTGLTLISHTSLNSQKPLQHTLQ